VTRKRFEARVRELYAGHAMLEQICSAMLTARSALQTEYAKLHKALLVIVRKDEVCRRLMTDAGGWSFGGDYVQDRRGRSIADP